jgi:hypothetical protein
MYNTINRINNQRYRFNSVRYNIQNEKNTSNLETSTTSNVKPILAHILNI